jgi:hypothetical protein
MNRALRISAVLIAFAVAPAGAKDRAEKEAIKAGKLAAKSGTAPSPANAEPPSKSDGFDAYKNVRLKNIFDPSRRGLRVETPPSSAGLANANRSRSLALTGTMVAEGRQLAFFGGSAADGNRVISIGNSVADYKVTAIAPTQVTLEHEGKAITLEVGRQISFEGSGGAAGESAAGPVVETAPAPAAEATGAPSLPGVAGDKAEILRKMMERRAKETGK